MTKTSKRATTKNPRIKRKRLFLQEKPLLQRRKLSNSGGAHPLRKTGNCRHGRILNCDSINFFGTLLAVPLGARLKSGFGAPNV